MRHFSWLSVPCGIGTNRINIIRVQLIYMISAVFLFRGCTGFLSYHMHHGLRGLNKQMTQHRANAFV